MQFQPIKFTHRPFHHHRLIKQADSTENVVRSSFPYLELARTGIRLQQWDATVQGRDERAGTEPQNKS